MIAQIILVLGLLALLMASGCLSPGQALDKGINQTVNVTGNLIDGIKGWFKA